MLNRARSILSLPLCVACAVSVMAQEADEEVSILRSENASGEAGREAGGAEPAPQAGGQGESVEIPVGTKLYDVESVEDLFREYQSENQRRAAEMAPHMNSDGLDVIELAPVQVDPYHIRNFDMLLEKIDPRPRQRLQRLAELDPQAAAELQVSMRAEERFFAGENEATFDPNAGRPAAVDFRKIGASVASALDRAKQAVRDKRMTDDQDALPVDEQ